MSAEILEYRLKEIERRLAALEAAPTFAGWLTPDGAAINVYYAPLLSSKIVGTMTGPRPFIRRTSMLDENDSYWYMLSAHEFVRAGDVRLAPERTPNREA